LADIYTAHRRRVELTRGTPPIQKLVGELAAWILDHKIMTLNPYELRAGGGIVPGARTRKTVHALLTELDDANWLQTPIPGNSNDPLPRIIVINPLVHELGTT
jgi:hypothetical protein